MDLFAKFAIIASLQAFLQSKFKISPENTYEVGSYLGTGNGGLLSHESQMSIYQTDPSKVNVFTIPALMVNGAACLVNIAFEIHGIAVASCAACATGLYNIGQAYEAIRVGKLKAAFAGGAEAPNTGVTITAFSNMNALSKNDKLEPSEVSRPWNLDRDGFVLSEGAGVFFLEEMYHAIKRGADILGEIVGYEASCDATHITQPEKSGATAIRSMNRVLEGIPKDEIGLVVAHATSTPINDGRERDIFLNVFGEGTKIPIIGPKSMMGHSIGAAGAVSAIVGVMASNSGVIPPTINHNNPDPACAGLDYVPNVARKDANINHSLSTAYGFGGQNAFLVTKKWSDA